MHKIATPTDLHTELKSIMTLNHRGATREELGQTLSSLAARVAGDSSKRAALGEPFHDQLSKIVSQLEDAVTKLEREMKGIKDKRSPEYGTCLKIQKHLSAAHDRTVEAEDLSDLLE